MRSKNLASPMSAFRINGQKFMLRTGLPSKVLPRTYGRMHVFFSEFKLTITSKYVNKWWTLDQKFDDPRQGDVICDSL